MARGATLKERNSVEEATIQLIIEKVELDKAKVKAESDLACIVVVYKHNLTQCIQWQANYSRWNHFIANLFLS